MTLNAGTPGVTLTLLPVQGDAIGPGQGFLGAAGWAWLVLAVVLVALFTIDLLSFRHARNVARTSLVWTVIWIGCGLAFSLFVLAIGGAERAGEYLAAFLLEKSLSLDNLFVFLVIFRAFDIPREHHRPVLLYGIIGAVIFRAIFIFAGVALIERWEWTTVLFAVLLMLAAVRMLRREEGSEGRLNAWLAGHMPVANDANAGRFLVRRDGRLMMTPMLLALIAVELTDIAFAIDSVPAAMAVSRDRFVIYSANVFAILGLRALYLTIEDSLMKLPNLRYGLAAVLGLAAVKLVVSQWVDIPAFVSVATIVLMLGGTIAFAYLRRPHSTSSASSVE